MVADFFKTMQRSDLLQYEPVAIEIFSNTNAMDHTLKTRQENKYLWRHDQYKLLFRHLRTERIWKRSDDVPGSIYALASTTLTCRLMIGGYYEKHKNICRIESKLQEVRLAKISNHYIELNDLECIQNFARNPPRSVQSANSLRLSATSW